jgi:hypothetical protein
MGVRFGLRCREYLLGAERCGVVRVEEQFVSQVSSRDAAGLAGGKLYGVRIPGLVQETGRHVPVERVAVRARR